MRLVIQRVSSASVTVAGQPVASMGRGLLILIGVGQGDTPAQADWLAEKAAHLRIFEDDEGKTNRSILDVGGEAIVVSQFTLYADARKGRRPSFPDAALPDVASPLVDYFAAQLRAHGVPAQTGQFGAHMQVSLTNDGPMTILLDRDRDRGAG